MLQDHLDRGGTGEWRLDSPARRGRVHVGLLAAAVGMLTLAGCSGEGEATASGTTVEKMTTSAATGTTVEGTITPTASGTTAEETITCDHADGYSLSYPADWQTYANAEDPDLGQLACGIFGTAAMGELEPQAELPWIPIRVKVEEGVSFEDATRPEARSGEAPSRDVETQETTVAGHPAVRVVSVSEASQDAPPSDSYLPGGTESVYWVVDLSTDITDKVLIAHAIPMASARAGVAEADKSAEGASSVDSTAGVLDAMIASLAFDD